MKEKEAIENRKNQIIDLIKEFCSQKLDNDYFELSDRLLDKLGRKRFVPFMSGKIEIWAAAVIHALGSINFLFDKSFQPYTTIDEINEFFGTNKSTTGSKSKIIRDLLNLSYFDSEFSTIHVKQNNPFDKLMMVDGFIVSKNVEQPVVKLDESKKKISRKAKGNRPIDDNQIDLFTN
ncbi:hypothetical protein H8E88_03210 [candidate division KSB1 bacterium]|nr:hypothetical protein [candidate division KSB1 bacterium]